MEYCIATDNDKEEIIEFINKVFEFPAKNLDFRTLIPKVYGDDKGVNEIHHLVKEDGKIAAVIAVYEREYRIGDRRLKTGYIGSVSVDADKRGKGYMKLLMKKAEEAMREKGISLAMLSGDRNRYGYFGYEVGGLRLKFEFEKRNITHTIGWGLDEVQLVQINDTDGINDDIYSLYEKGRVCACMRDEFYERSLTWDSILYAVKNGEKTMGYVVTSKDHYLVREIELNDWSFLLSVIRSLMIMGGKEQLVVYTLTWEYEKNMAMQQACEQYAILPACSYKVLDYKKTIEALLALQMECGKVSDDIFTIEIDGRCCYRIEVNDGNVQVNEIAYAKANKETADNFRTVNIFETPDITVSGRAFISAFMSPAYYLYEKKAKRAYPTGWLPFVFAPAIVDEF